MMLPSLAAPWQMLSLFGGTLGLQLLKNMVTKAIVKTVAKSERDFMLVRF
jgi:hypothetical protein